MKIAYILCEPESQKARWEETTKKAKEKMVGPVKGQTSTKWELQ